MADYADGPDLDVYENSPFAREHYTDQLISELADIAGITDTDKLGREIRIWAGLHHKIFRNVTEETRHSSVKKQLRSVAAISQEFGQEIAGVINDASVERLRTVESSGMRLSDALAVLAEEGVDDVETLLWFALVDSGLGRADAGMAIQQARKWSQLVANAAQEAADKLAVAKGPIGAHRHAAVRRPAMDGLVEILFNLADEKPGRRVRDNESYGPALAFATKALEPIFGKTDGAGGIDNDLKLSLHKYGEVSQKPAK